MKGIIINKETGEIVDELNEGDRIRKKAQDDYYNSQKDLIEINKEEDFVKVFGRTMTMLMEEEDLTLNELKICLSMISYIGYESGLLRYENNGRLLKLKDIETITKLPKISVVKAMNNLVSKKIYGVHRTGRQNAYTVNPFIFMKGRYINKTLYNLYKNTKWAKK